MHSNVPLAHGTHAAHATQARRLAFARLVPYSKPLRGMAMLMRERAFTPKQVRALIAANEVADLHVYLESDFDDATYKYHLKWMQQVRRFYELPDEPAALSEMCYLIFRDVGAHEDGERYVTQEGTFLGEPLLFLNIQLAGDGELQAAGQTLAVQPGDAYLLNPLVEHSWTSRHHRGPKGLCRAISFVLPMSLVPGLLRGSGAGNPAYY